MIIYVQRTDIGTGSAAIRVSGIEEDYKIFDFGNSSQILRDGEVCCGSAGIYSGKTGYFVQCRDSLNTDKFKIDVMKNTKCGCSTNKLIDKDRYYDIHHNPRGSVDSVQLWLEDDKGNMILIARKEFDII